MLDLLFPLLDEPDAPAEFTLIRVSRRAMATTFEVAIPAGTHRDAIPAATAALDLIDELEDQLTVYREHSEVSRLNAAGADAPVVVERELFELFERCATWTVETEGAFDVATGAIIKAWGFFRREGQVPEPKARVAAMARTGFRHVMLNAESRAAKFRVPGLEINLARSARAYALDRAAASSRPVGRAESALARGRQQRLRDRPTARRRARLAHSPPPPVRAGGVAGHGPPSGPGAGHVGCHVPVLRV